MKILIVDDKKEDLYLLETLLKGSGFEVVSVRNGVEALEKLKKDSIDMIISDILMPKMDGFQLCRECKSDDTLKKMPFVFYTATYTDKKDEEFALSLGAEKFIVKPIDPNVFLKILESVIKEYREGTLVAPKRPIEEETVYLEEYNKRLIKKLEKKMLDLKRDITERKRAEEALRKRTSDLGERVKELNCLYGISQLVEKPEISLEEILQGTIDLIPPAWQYPEITCARIVLEDRVFKTSNFKRTIWKQDAEMMAHGDKLGFLEVCYLEEKPETDEGPFLREERNLINDIAERVGEITERKRAEEKIKGQNEFLNNVIESFAHPFYVLDANNYRIKMANFAAHLGSLSEHSTCYALTHKRSKPCGGAEHLCPLEEVKKTRKSVIVEHIHYDEDGNARIVEVHGHPIFDDKGNVIQMIEYCLDITERKRAEEALRKSEKQASAAIEAARALTFSYDIATGKINWGGAIEEITGYTEEEFAKVDIQNWADRIHPDDRDEIVSILQEAMGKDRATAEYRFRTKKGYVILSSISLTEKQNGKPVRLVGILQDITERKRAEEALRESEEKLRTILESSPDAITVTDLKGNVIECNQATLDVHGFSTKEEVIGKNALDFIAAKDHEKVAENTEKTLMQGSVRNVEYTLLTKDGREFPGELSASVISDSSGKPTSFVAITKDITERKRAEEALRLQSEIAANMAEGVYLIRASDGVIVYTNPKFEEIFGYGPDEMLGKHVSIVNAPTEKSPEETAKEISEFINKHGFWRGEINNIKKDGTPFWCYASVSMFDHPEHGKVWVVVHTDITERKRAEEKLRQSEKKYRTLVETAQEGISITDPDENMTFTNQAFADLLGYTKEELLGLNLSQISDKEEFTKFRKETKKRQRGGSSKYEIKLYTKAGEVKYFDVSATPLADEKGNVTATLALLADITERKRAEELLRESEKLAATGRMAARIAHEINNPLGGIKNSFLLIKDAIPKDHTYYEYVGRIEKEIDRITHIVHQMFDLYRQDREPTKQFSVDETIRDVVALLESSCRQHQVNIELDTGGAPVVDAMPEGSIRQVLFNIIQNAIEASPPGKMVKVTAGASKNFFTLTVSDQGKGVPEEARSHIFEPFFTTKSAEVTGGLGLGLSVSKSLVEAMGGSLDFESKTGKGTKFNIVLPIERLKKEEQNG